MTGSALGFLVLAAFLHAGWNTLVKESSDKLTFTWLALTVSGLAGLPLLATGPLPLRVWPFAAASSGAEVFYYLVLTRAYERGDLSWVYPLARGSALPLLALWGEVFLGENLSGAGLAGIAVIVAGIVTLGGAGFRSVRAGKGGSVRGAGIWALSAGAATSVYSAIDKAALGVAAITVYLELIFALTALFLAPAVLLGPRRTRIAPVLRESLSSVLFVGLANPMTYLLVLLAFRLAPVSYAGSVREMSVLIAVLLGWKGLGEPSGQRRLAAAVLIFAGIVLITWKG